VFIAKQATECNTIVYIQHFVASDSIEFNTGKCKLSMRNEWMRQHEVGWMVKLT
jgi:hypothetical protein